MSDEINSWPMDDIQRARLRRDLKTVPTDREVTIVWRGGAYRLVYDDYGSGEPDGEWLAKELYMVARRIARREKVSLKDLRQYYKESRENYG